MRNRRVVLTGYGMMALERKDREKFNRLNEMVSDGLRKSEEAPYSKKPDPELDRCSWCCPTTCANCKVVDCSDRLAGGDDNA